jgi:hypothetical protein
MELLQFAVPQRLGTICAESVARVAGGATLLEGGWGWWINGDREVERERVSWLIVGVEGDKADEVIETVKGILKSSGESAIFFVRQKPTIESL